MGLDTIIRNGIALADSLTASLQVAIDHYAWISNGTYAEATYATVVSRQAIVEFKQRLYRLASGQEVLQRASIMFIRPIAANGASGRREPIDPRDKIVLPNGYTGPILDVIGIVDPNTDAPYILKVVLG